MMKLNVKMISTLVVMILFSFICSCSKEKKDTGKSYSFNANANASLSLKPAAFSEFSASDPSLSLVSDGPILCSDVVCFTPTALTGKYFGVGFLIQSSGNGMVAYFGQDSWSTITGTSDMYDFDSANPITNSGTLFCCNGTGDLSSNQTYIEDVMYLFAYVDATFTVSGVTGNTTMNREFTVRFVFADDAITNGKRGDLLLKDPADGAFKWIDSSVSAGGNVSNGNLVATRPSSPITMNSSVTNWTNPFGANQGNQHIPVIYAPILTASESGPFTITEKELAITGRSYAFSFNPKNFIMFPAMMKSDINMLSSYSELLSRIHLGGLPHSMHRGVGSPAGTTLIINEP